MWHNIDKQVKRKMSEYVLDWAERRHGGIQASDAENLIKVYSKQAKEGSRFQRLVAYLQYQRANQRKQAEEDFQRTRISDDTTFDLLSFSIFEIFHVEQFDQIERGVIELFPTITKRFLFFENFADEFQKRAGAFQNNNYLRIGYILPSKSKHRGGMDVWRAFKELPLEIDFIEVSLHKILPSVFMIRFDIYMNESANKQIINLHNQKYLPELRFKTFNLLRVEYSGSTGTTSTREMQFAIARWIDSVRLKVEICIRPYLSGYFTSTHTQRKVRLPAFEIYSLKDTPQKEEDFVMWKRDNADWLRSLGFNLDYYGYRNRSVHFSLLFDEYEEDRLSNYIFVIFEKYIRTAGKIGHDDRTTIQYDVFQRFSHIIAFMSVIKFLDCIEQQVSLIRKDVTDHIQKNRRLKSIFRVNSLLYRNSMIFNRVVSEIDIQMNEGYYNFNDMASLKMVAFDRVIYDVNLKDDIKKLFMNKRAAITQQIDYLDVWFSKYIVARNTEISYAIQKWVIFLTLITIVVGLLAIDWQQTGCRYQGILTRLISSIEWCSANNKP